MHTRQTRRLVVSLLEFEIGTLCYEVYRCLRPKFKPFICFNYLPILFVVNQLLVLLPFISKIPIESDYHR